MATKTRNVVIALVAVLIIAVGAFLVLQSPSQQPQKTQTSSAQPSSTSSAQPGLSGSLTILVPTGDPTLMPYIQLAAGEFMKRYPGVKITIQPVPFGQMVQTALTALQNKNPDPALIIFYPSQASTLGPYLMDLRPYLSSGVLNKSDIPTSAMLSVMMVAKNGTVTKIFGVPFQMVFGYVLVYRKSIFNNPALQSEFRQKYGFDLDPLTWSSWDQFVSAAEFLQSKQVAKYALLFPDGLQ